MSLADPEKKMSKSDPKSCLFISDSPEDVRAKLKKAVTGTDGSGASRGAENLLYLLSHFGTPEHIATFADAQKNRTLKYSELKEVLAEDISAFFADFREKKQALMENPERIAKILAEGARTAQTIANTTLFEVKQKIGLL
jgi:tryptophanyl-tRNA synthetase